MYSLTTQTLVIKTQKAYLDALEAANNPTNESLIDVSYTLLNSQSTVYLDYIKLMMTLSTLS